jgi:hypothetical protein
MIKLKAEIKKLWENANYIGAIIPTNIVEILPKGKVRIEGKYNNSIKFNLAINKLGDLHYTYIKVKTLKELNLKIGDAIDMSFEIVDNEKINYPEELIEFLTQDEEFYSAFEKLSIGKKRNIAHIINSTKSIENKIEKLIKMSEDIKASKNDINTQ